MNSIKSLILLFAVVINFFSCQNEPLDTALLNQISTNEDCSVTSNLQTTSINNGSTINLIWSSVGVATSWQVEYGLTESYILGAGTKLTTNFPTININNLFAANSYTFTVRALCGSDFGEWSESIITVGNNPNCLNPTNLTASRSTLNTTEISVNWNAPTTQNLWEIQYSTSGFTLGTGIIISSNSKPKLITGLLAVGYDFYIRSKCSSSEFSNWIGPINVPALR